MTRDQLADLVYKMMQDSINNPKDLMLGNSSTDGAPVIYDPKTNIVVIRDPTGAARGSDAGTVFKPRTASSTSWATKTKRLRPRSQTASIHSHPAGLRTYRELPVCRQPNLGRPNQRCMRRWRGRRGLGRCLAPQKAVVQCRGSPSVSGLLGIRPQQGLTSSIRRTAIIGRRY